MVLEKIPTFSEVQEWVNTSADVPNADHADTADDADTIGGLLKLNSNNELIVEDPNTGETRPVKFEELALPTATAGDTAPDDRAIAIDPNTGELLTPE